MTDFAQLPRVCMGRLFQKDSKDEELTKIKNGIFVHGFFIFINSGITQKSINQGYEALRKIFALDEHVKQRYERPDFKYQEGRIPWNLEHSEHTDTAKEPSDHKECWHIKNGINYPRVWPQEVREFDVLEQLFFQFEEIGIQLLDAIGTILGREPNFYREQVTSGDSLFRLLHYKLPETFEGANDPEALKQIPWAAKHTDIGYLTILPTAMGKSLHVQSHTGEVIVPELAPGEMIAQIGDTLMRQSQAAGDSPHVISTSHWVQNVNGDPERFSYPFFVHPKRETIIDESTGLTAGAFLDQRLAKIGLSKEQPTS